MAAAHRDPQAMAESSEGEHDQALGGALQSTDHVALGRAPGPLARLRRVPRRVAGARERCRAAGRCCAPCWSSSVPAGGDRARGRLERRRGLGLLADRALRAPAPAPFALAGARRPYRSRPAGGCRRAARSLRQGSAGELEVPLTVACVAVETGRRRLDRGGGARRPLPRVCARAAGGRVPVDRASRAGPGRDAAAAAAARRRSQGVVRHAALPALRAAAGICGRSST